MKNWYELNQKDRISQVFSKYTLDDFWSWWSGNQEKTMEVRIRDFQLVKEVAAKINVPYAAPGIYVKNAYQLKQTISLVRHKATMWFGVNPRKRNINERGQKYFGGKDTNIEEVGFIFLDIDRDVKIGEATQKDLMNADKLVNHILNAIREDGFANSYVRICSGNGVQLIIKLDFPIKVPEITFNKIKDAKGKIIYVPIPTDEYENVKDIIRKGIGNQIYKFCRRFPELKVSVDKSGFNMGRVAALPVTKNFKHDGFTWRGVVQLENKENTGLSDYCLNCVSTLNNYRTKNIFTGRKTSVQYKITKGKLMEHCLIRFILDNELPYGEINNKLWFQLKCLLRDSKTDLNTTEFRLFMSEFEAKVKGRMSLNFPDKKFSFDINIVNSFAINALLPPPFPVYEKRSLKNNYYQKLPEWEMKNFVDDEIKLLQETTIQEDMDLFKTMLRPEDWRPNKDKFGKFLKGSVTKYGENKTKYYYKYIFDKYIRYDYSDKESPYVIQG